MAFAGMGTAHANKGHFKILIKIYLDWQFYKKLLQI